MTSPGHWTHTTERALDGPMVVFDLDGVIADADHRQHHLREGRPDWDAFFAAADTDPVIAAGAALAAAIDDEHGVVILTGRPATIRDLTVAWLDANAIRHDLLIMRPPKDRRSAVEYKVEELAALAADGADVRLVLDDAPLTVAELGRIGIPVLHVHSGYYDDGPSG